MDRDFYVRLTLALHRVADSFSKEEKLTYKIKDSANGILINLILFLGKDLTDAAGLLSKLEELDGYFTVVQGKQLTDQRNLLVLKREYDKIRKSLRKLSFPIEKLSFSTNRQQKIVDVLKSNGKIRLGELTPVFPQVNRRTILRDLDALLTLGLVERQGNGRGVSYKLNGVKDKSATLITT